MKMLGLCWTAVMLTLVLSAGTSFAAVDKQQLADIVQFIMNKYNINTQVSVAVNIPEKDPKLEDVFKNNKINKWVVTAKPIFNVKKKTDHAEAVVLENIKPLVDNRKGNFLVFYTFYSPCASKCTNKENKLNIIGKINEVFPKWTNKAFVFSKAFENTGVKSIIEATTESLEELGKSKIGRGNIFRCYGPKTEFKCINCFEGETVVQECVQN
ncbi:uncharacterized protein LOC122979142 [Scomber scombrus]|uniref:Uncharacterized protein LOC122979142 n=1 Tax=Scomber scombrus TaxID=13677 RepID=A0AAV1PWF0_SCOSC